MTPSTAAIELRAFLDRASTRLFWIGAAQGAAMGLGAAVVLALFNHPPRGATVLGVGIALFAAALGAVVRVLRTSVFREPIAKQVESRAPHCRNVVVTADELTRTSPRRALDLSS